MAWTNKTKNPAGTSTQKEKIATETQMGRILTPDGNPILLGQNEDLVLIWQRRASLWLNVITKITGDVWLNKTKTPIT